jgi:dienelactone hydrolase
MKRARLIALALAVCTQLSACLKSPSPANPVHDPVPIADELAAKAKEFLSCLARRDYDAAELFFSEDMARALPKEKLGEAWASTERGFGAFKSINSESRRLEKGLDVVILACRFEKGDADIRVVFDRDARVAGFWIGAAAASADAYRPPSYARPSKFIERELSVGSGEWILPGTLTLPRADAPVPALVLVHGSGPNDRDETIGPNKVFKDIAWGLASRGIAVLRYEKRTRQYPERTAAAARDFTVDEEVVEDAVHALRLLASDAAIDPDRLFVLGHSLGGTLVPRIAAAAPELTGCILLAGASRPLQELIVEQVEYLASLEGAPSADQSPELQRIRREAAKVDDPALAGYPPDEAILGAYPAYWLDLRSYNPVEAALRVEKPLLFMQGGRDYQVTEADFEGWKGAFAGTANATFRLYPDLNHLFMSGRGRSTPAEYEKAGHVSRSVIDDIAAWIRAARPGA